MNFTENDHDYRETAVEAETGHTDTRGRNMECEGPLGCDLGIDVAG